jgi:hypothetical protein
MNASAQSLWKINFALIIISAGAALWFWLGPYWSALVIFPALLYLRKNKPETEEEKEKRDDLSAKSFAFFALLPVAIILLFCLYIILKVIPNVVGQ